MTPPFFIGQEVKIVGPSKGNSLLHMGQTFEISQSKDGFYSKRDMPWYPASSLQLVDEELKIGDWVEIIGPSRHGFSEAHGVIFKIEQVLGHEYSAPGVAWYQAKCLRKLTSEEIAMHTSKANTFTVKIKCDTSELEAWLDKAIDKVRTSSTGTIGYEMQELQVATVKGMAALGELLVPIVEKHVEDAIKRLSAIENKVKRIDERIDAGVSWEVMFNERQSAIESRMDSIGPSHAELMGDVEALAEKVGAIERRQDRQTETSDILAQRLAAQKTRMDKQQKAIDCLEAYQRGEMPEVIDREQAPISDDAFFSVEEKPGGDVSVTYSDGGIELAKRVLDGTWKG